MFERFRSLLSAPASPVAMRREPVFSVPERLRDVRHPGRPMAARSMGFAAADGSALFAGWVRANKISDVWIRQQLNVVRSRSRDLSWNNDYARSALALLARHVIGSAGVAIKANVRNQDGTRDKTANAAIDDGYATQSKKGNFTLDGKLSRMGASKLWLRRCAVDGEVIWREVPGANNATGYAVEFVPVDLLNTQFCQELPNGNYIYMGIEFSPTRRVVAYWLLTSNPNGERFGATGSRYERVPAELIHHSYLVEDIDQSRGVPWMVSGMAKLKMLGGYEEAIVVAARIAASKVAVYSKISPYAGDPPADIKTDDGRFIDELEPGTTSIAPEGWKLDPIDWNSPEADTGDFMAAMLRGFGAGLGMGYNTLGNNVEKVSYAAGRLAKLEDQDGYRMIQSFEVEEFEQPAKSGWLKYSLQTGRLTAPGPNGVPAALPFTKFEKFDQAKYRPRGWMWVDPQKEGVGNQIAVALTVTNRTRIAAAMGVDIEDIADEIADEIEMFAERGIVLPPIAPPSMAVTSATSAAAPAVADDDTDGEEPPDDGADGASTEE